MLIRRGKRLAYAEANILDDRGNLIAKGSASFMIMNGVKYIHTLKGVNGHNLFPTCSGYPLKHGKRSI